MARKIGQIVRRGARTWLVRVYNGRNSETKKRKYLNETIHGGFRDAQAHLNRMLSERDRGRNLESSKQTLNQFLDGWLELCAKPRLRAKSLRDYEGLLRRYVRPRLGTKALAIISAFDVQTLYKELLERRLSARSIRYTHAVLRSALKQAARWNLILANPADSVDLPRQGQRRVGVLSVEQARHFIKTIAGHHYQALFALAITTGMRPSEYLALTWNSIDLEHGTASIARTLEWKKGGWQFADTKRSHSRRLVKLQEWVVALLRVQISKDSGACGDDLVFLYQAEIDSILSGQESIAQDIFQQLRLRAESQFGTTSSEEAYKEYLKGRYWFRTCSYEGFQKCKHHLMQSLAEDPQNPAAHAALAEAFVALALYGDEPPVDRMADAQREAERASECGISAYSQLAIGLIAGFQQWNWAAAESAFLRAIEMNPTLSCAHQWYASACLAPAGRVHEAAAELKRALEPDPLSILIVNQFALVLTAAGQIDFAIKQLGECLDLDKNVALTHWTLGLAFTSAERISEAIEAFERATELSAGASYAHASLAYARAVAGQSAGAIHILEQLEQRSKNRYVPPIDLGLVHLGLGNHSEAFDYFEQARERRCSRLIWMNIDPRMQHLRGDPRFERLLKALGLGPSSR